VPEEKFAYEKYTGSALAANCVRSMQQVCARSVRKIVCRRKKFAYEKYTRSKYATYSCSTDAASVIYEVMFLTKVDLVDPRWCNEVF
jgi:hypothetical protein